MVVVLLAAPPASAVRPPPYGGLLRIAAVGHVKTLDPAEAVTFGEWLTIGLIHGGLYRLDAAGNPVPDMLAAPCTEKRTSSSNAAKRWRCVLRRDVRFHDGRVARAADVKHSFARRPGRARTGGWVSQFVSVSVIDDWTIRLKTARGLSGRELGLLLASPALAVARVGAPGLGIGAFRIDGRHADGSTTELRYFAQHHRGRPYLDGVSIVMVPSRRAAIEAFHYQKSDLVFVDSPRYKEAVRVPGPFRETVGLLVRDRPAVRDVATRRLIAASVPRARLAERIEGKTRASRALIPHKRIPKSAALAPNTAASVSQRWFVGAPEALQPVGKTLAAAMGAAGRPWSVQPLDRFTMRRALQNRQSGRWDVVLTPWQFPTASPDAALRSLAGLCGMAAGADPARALNARVCWIPLVDRARMAVHRGQWHAIRWTDAGTLHLADAWRRK